jgi:hypothetical protein
LKVAPSALMLWPDGFYSPVTPFVLMMLVTLEIVFFAATQHAAPWAVGCLTST